MIVNGKDFDLNILEAPTLNNLISHFKLKLNMVAVERNGSIEERSDWEKVTLTQKDRIELIKFIGGG